MQIIIYIILLFQFYSCSKINETTINKARKTSPKNSNDKPVKSKTKSIPDGLLKLVKAYPDYLDSADEKNIYWKDGTVMEWDDGISNKTHDEKLDNADLEDMMSQKYAAGENWDSPPEKNFEPGRIRNEPFFKKMYGNSSSEVKKHLTTITWLPNISGENIQITTANGIDEKLKTVSDELEKLPSEFHKYIKNIGGTFNWRNIAGTNRLSTHSFGTSIDINTKYSHYWQWSGINSYQNQIPIEIVLIFEKYGFIWGGKWYHYDTMHFEYRPELLQ
jgi:peptidoglycan LD-endopeptidase CwlK